MQINPQQQSTYMKSGVNRISISLPPDVVRELNQIEKRGGFPNRSVVIAELIRRHAVQDVADHKVMAGNISIVYDESKNQVQEKLAKIQRLHVDTVISSLSVLLENQDRMDVWIVQGSKEHCNKILKKIKGLKGILTSELTLSQSLLPPIHHRN